MAGERTEEPTQRRLDDSRAKGQVARSHEITSAALALVGFLVLPTCATNAYNEIGALMRESFNRMSAADLTVNAAAQLGTEAEMTIVRAWVPLFGALVVLGLAVNLGQTRFLFSLKPMMPDFNRVNPLAGFQRMFSMRSLVEFGKAVAKISIIGLVVYQAVLGQLPKMIALSQTDVNAAAVAVSGAALGICVQVSAALLLIGALDYLYQRREYLSQLRMTKEEVKQEARDTEGKPEVRGRIRQLQRQLAQGRSVQKARLADVVVVNPTHFAVALQYRADEMKAPKVIAKGRDLIARQIKRVAGEAGVPVVENPPLARSLYRSTEIGQEVPAELYQAVAELLAFVYSLKRKA